METGEGNQLEPVNLSSVLMVKIYTAKQLVSFYSSVLMVKIYTTKQLVSFYSFCRSELYMTL